LPISDLSEDFQGFELRMAKYVSGYGSFWNVPSLWLEKTIGEYGKEKGQSSPPQLSVASWIAAAMCVNAMYHIVTGKAFEKFPKFYLSSLNND
jgi:hypothetical protein